MSAEDIDQLLLRAGTARRDAIARDASHAAIINDVWENNLTLFRQVADICAELPTHHPLALAQCLILRFFLEKSIELFEAVPVGYAGRPRLDLSSLRVVGGVQ